MTFTVQSHRLTIRLRPNGRTIACLLLTPNSKKLIHSSFCRSCETINKNCKTYYRAKKAKYEEIEQGWIPDPGNAGIFILLNQEF